MSSADAYPSRTGGKGGILPRRDPVVYSSETGRENGPLTGETLAAFEREGYLCFAALVDPVTLEREAQQMFRDRAGDPSPKVVREPDGDEVRSIFEVHEDEGTFRALVRDPKLLLLAEQILGGPVYVHQSRINYKPAFRGQPFYWHSDFETWHVEDGMPRMRALSLSINLTDHRPDNGPLMVIPESHQQYVACAGETPKDHYERSLRRQEAGIPPETVLESMAKTHGIVSPAGGPGTATLFDCNLLHGSNSNITPFPRTNLFVVYNSVENALQEPFSGQVPRPQYIANRDPTPLP